MSEKHFWRIWSVLKLPKDPNNIVEDDDSDIEESSNVNVEVEPRYVEDGFKAVRGLFNTAIKQWQHAWRAGTRLVIDETMIWWTGLTEGHLSYLPRKPTPLGF